MGFFKRCCANCLAMCCLIPMAWISFTVFDLGAAVSGGLFTGIGDALTTAFEMVFGSVGGGTVASVLVGGFIGIFLITLFPIHWLLYYRPDEPMMALAMMIPWILATFITALIFAKSMKEGFLTGIYLALGYIGIGLLILLALNLIIGQALGSPETATQVTSLINSTVSGLTDLPSWGALILSCLEGGAIGGCFGALAGAIRYNPKDKTYQPKNAPIQQNAVSQQAYGQPAPGYPGNYSNYSSPTTMAPPSGTPAPGNAKFCGNCGAQMGPNEQFCGNCGNKL